jgi:cGMP-dependent protein kinase
MLSQNKAKRVESALRVGSDSVMAVITFQRILQLIGGELEQVLKRNEQSHEKKIKNLGDRQDMSHIKVEDLVFIKKLGQGQFGSVYLVQHKQDKSKVYALKSVSKASVRYSPHLRSSSRASRSTFCRRRPCWR